MILCNPFESSTSSFLFVCRCDDEVDKHSVYIARNNQDFPSLDKPSFELSGDDNIIPINAIDITINSGEPYKWRVDCVKGINNMRITGDVWVFTMHD